MAGFIDRRRGPASALAIDGSPPGTFRVRSVGASSFRASLVARTTAFFAFALVGCANGPRFYDETRSKQAAQVVTDWKSADSTAVIAAHQATLNAFRDQDLANVDALAKSSRDLALRGIVGSPIGGTTKVPGYRDIAAGIGSRINDKLQTDLVGSLTPQNTLTGFSLSQVDSGAANWWAWRTAQDAQSKLLITYDIRFKLAKLSPLPRCADLLKAGKTGDPLYTPRVLQALALLDDKDQDTVTTTLEDMRTNVCASIAASPVIFDAIANFGNQGALAKANLNYQKALDAESIAEGTAATAQTAYAKSKADYETAVKNSDGGANATKKIADASKKLKDDIEKLEKAAAASRGLTAKFISDERLKSLDDFVTTVNTNVAAGTVPENTPKTAAAVILLTGLVDSAKSTIADGKIPLNLPMQIKRDQEQLKSDAAALQVSSWKTQIQLKKQLVDTLTQEVLTLAAARKDLAKAASATTTDKFNVLLFTVAAADPSMQLQLKSATLRYLSVIGELDAKRHKLEYQILDAQYDEGLAQDAVALKQWNSLITLSTGQLADYYENATIKPETLVSLVQLLMLAWIGNGTNK